MGGIVASAKVDIGAVGECLGTDRMVHLYGFTPSVDANLAEVSAKSWLHISAHGVRQRATTSFTHAELLFYSVLGIKAFLCWIGRSGLNRLVAPIRPSLVERSNVGNQRLTLQQASMTSLDRSRGRESRIWHAHHSMSNLIGFFLVMIFSRSDGQLRLKCEDLSLRRELLRINQISHSPVAQSPL
jgi:hypothetical protein